MLMLLLHHVMVHQHITVFIGVINLIVKNGMLMVDVAGLLVTLVQRLIMNHE